MCWLLALQKADAQGDEGQKFITFDHPLIEGELQNAISTSDGNLLLLGNTPDNKQVFLSKVTSDGALQFAKNFGSTTYKNYALALTAFPDGRIWTGGHYQNDDGYQAWIAGLTANGISRFNTSVFGDKAFCTVSQLSTSIDGQFIYGAGIKSGRPWYFEFNDEGKLTFQEDFIALWGKTGVQAEQVSFFHDGKRLYLYGAGSVSNGKKVLFLLRYVPGSVEIPILQIITTQNIKLFNPDYSDIVSAGRIVKGPGGKLLLTATIEAKNLGSQALMLAMDKNLCLETTLDFGFGGSGQESAIDVVADEKGMCALLGTRKLLSETEDVVVWKCMLETKPKGVKPISWGGKYPEYAVRLLRGKGAVWIFGNQRKKGDVKCFLLPVTDIF